MDTETTHPQNAPQPEGQTPESHGAEPPAPAKRRFSWWRLIVSILLALITAGLVWAIMLPAIVAPKR